MKRPISVITAYREKVRASGVDKMGRIRRYIITAVLLSTLVLSAAPVSVCAQPETEETGQAETSEEGTQAGTDGEELDEAALKLEKEKKKSYETVPETNEVDGWPEGPKIYGNSGIVMDMDSGAVLYAKQPDEKRYPASITKLLTALVALENGEMLDEVAFSQESINILRSDYASIGMRPGEVISMEDAMYALLLASANEVAYAIAESTGTKMGGGYETFIQEMNDRSAELGCIGSHWTNANGLHDEDHYTTARDMALITSALYRYGEFQTIAQTLEYTIGATNLEEETRTFQQHHKMLMPENKKYYKYATGGKTGYTDDSRTTLVTTAEKGDMRLVCVVLKDDGDAYDDTKAMLDYGFGNFTKLPLAGQKLPEEVVSCKDGDAYVVLPKGLELKDLEYETEVTDEKERTGVLTYSYGGQKLGEAPVILTPEYVEEATGYSTRPKLSEDTQTGQDKEGAKKDGTFAAWWDRLPVWGKVLAAAALLLLLGAAVLVLRARLIRRAKKAAKRRRRRGRRRAGRKKSGAQKERSGQNNSGHK